MTIRRKHLPVIAGAGALAVLTTLAFSWREITIQYHVWRLRREPDYVREAIDQPERTVVRDALRRALATPDGAATFSRVVVLEVLEVWGRRPDEVREGEKLSIQPRDYLAYVEFQDDPDIGLLGVDAKHATRLETVCALLPEIESPTYRFPGMGELRFRIVCIPIADSSNSRGIGQSLLITTVERSGEELPDSEVR